MPRNKPGHYGKEPAVIEKMIDQITQLRVALDNELNEETPNEKTVLAIRGQIRNLDIIIEKKMVFAGSIHRDWVAGAR